MQAPDLSKSLLLSKCSVKGFTGCCAVLQGEVGGLWHGEGGLRGLNGPPMPRPHWLCLHATVALAQALVCVF